jgi:transposase
LSRREQARVQVLNGVLEGRWDVREVAVVMEVSERHVWRVLAAYRKEGIAALATGL